MNLADLWRSYLMSLNIREVLVETDLPAPIQAKRQAERRRTLERAKDPHTLNLPDRVARLEVILGLDQPT